MFESWWDSMMNYNRVISPPFSPPFFPFPMGAAARENQENIKYHRKVNNWKCYHSSVKDNRYLVRGGKPVGGLVEEHRFLTFEVIWLFKKFSVKQDSPILYLQKKGIIESYNGLERTLKIHLALNLCHQGCPHQLRLTSSTLALRATMDGAPIAFWAQCYGLFIFT